MSATTMLASLTRAKTILAGCDGYSPEQHKIDDAIAAIDEALTVDYADILAATHLENDEDGKPWMSGDCLDHELVRIDGRTEAKKAKAAIYTDRAWYRIELKDTTSTYKWLRKRGASKQVARECQADQNRQMVEIVKEYLTDGWEAYGVVCDYEGYEHSCWGFIGKDHAKENYADIAGEVVAQMRADGYTIVNEPKREAPSPVRHSYVNEQNRR